MADELPRSTKRTRPPPLDTALPPKQQQQRRRRKKAAIDGEPAGEAPDSAGSSGVELQVVAPTPTTPTPAAATATTPTTTTTTTTTTTPSADVVAANALSPTSPSATSAQSDPPTSPKASPARRLWQLEMIRQAGSRPQLRRQSTDNPVEQHAQQHMTMADIALQALKRSNNAEPSSSLGAASTSQSLSLQPLLEQSTLLSETLASDDKASVIRVIDADSVVPPSTISTRSNKQSGSEAGRSDGGRGRSSTLYGAQQPHVVSLADQRAEAVLTYMHHQQGSNGWMWRVVPRTVFKWWRKFQAGMIASETSFGATKTSTVTLWMTTLLLVDISMCVLYVVERSELETYDPNSQEGAYIGGRSNVTVDDIWWTTPRPTWLFVLNCIFSYLSTFGTVIRLLYTLMTTENAVILALDALTAHTFVVMSWISFGLVRSLYVPYYLRIWVTLPKLPMAIETIRRALGRREDSTRLTERIMVIILTVAAFVFTGMCAINWAENIWGTPLSMFDSFYFMIVTIGTIGYGDISPVSWQGRLVIILVIGGALYLIPDRVSSLAQSFALQRESGGHYSRPLFSSFARPHIVICAPPKHDTPIFDVLNELCSSDPAAVSNRYHIVVLINRPVSAELLRFMSHPLLRGRVKVLRASALNDDDLARADTQSAKAIFILADKYHPSSALADRHNVLCAWSAADHCRLTKLYVLNVRPETRVQITEAELVLSASLYKQALLANHCLFRGTNTLLCNLWRQSSAVKGHSAWVDEYGDGLGNELYESTVSSRYIGKLFSAVALDIFELYSMIVIGVKIKLEDNTTEHILLNPCAAEYEYILKQEDKLYLIAQGQSDVDVMIAGERFIAAHDFEYAAHAAERVNPSADEPFAMDTRSFEMCKGRKDIPPLIYLPRERPSTTDYERTCVVDTPSKPFLGAPTPECLLLKQPRTIAEATIRNRVTLKQHILVMGDIRDFFFFVCILRSSHRRFVELYPILFFSSQLPTAEEWSPFARFPDVFLFLGEADNAESLRNAGVQVAHRVCIMSNPDQVKDSDSKDTNTWREFEDESMIDAASIMTTSKIIDLLGDLKQAEHIVTELVHRQNYRFIPPKMPPIGEEHRTEDYRYLLSPAYASGRLLSTSMIEGLLFQSFLGRPQLPDVINLLCGLKNAMSYQIDDFLHVQHQHLACIQVPNEIFSMTAEALDCLPEELNPPTFRVLFRYLVMRHFVIPVAIYRTTTEQDCSTASWRYVCTNPYRTMPMRADQLDRVFVIAPSTANPLFQRHRAEMDAEAANAHNEAVAAKAEPANADADAAA